MEYADGGDLYARILDNTKKNSHFPEDHIWKILIQTVRGLKTLHEHNILHRDLKVIALMISQQNDINRVQTYS